MKEIIITPAPQDSKLLYVLESFSPTDLSRFRRFLTSPYFNQQDTLIALYDILLPVLRGKATQYPDRSTIYHRLYQTRYTDVKMRRIYSDLLKLAEEYIGYERYREQHALSLADTLHATNTRGISKIFDANYSLAKITQSKNKDHDAEYHYTEFLLEVEMNQHLELQKQRSDNKNLGQVLHHLDVFYFITKLRYACAIEHYRNVLKIDLKVAMIDAIMAQVQEPPFSSISAIAIYSDIYHMLREADGEPYYNDLKKQLQSHDGHIAQATERDAYIFSINFCVKQINRGQLDYLREVFDLYNIALEKDFLFDKNELSPWDYKNLVTLGLRLKEHSWTEKFIKEYRERLPRANRSNAYTFNLAKFYFYIRRYDDVLKLLQDVKYDDIFYLLDSKTLLVKTYYEMTEYSALYSLISSFKALIRRKRKISDTHKRNYINLLNFTAALSKADVRDTQALATLRAEFDKTTQMADAGWLREKFEELGAYPK
jgi:hypothetical protein